MLLRKVKFIPLTYFTYCSRILFSSRIINFSNFAESFQSQPIKKLKHVACILKTNTTILNLLYLIPSLIYCPLALTSTYNKIPLSICLFPRSTSIRFHHVMTQTELWDLPSSPSQRISVNGNFAFRLLKIISVSPLTFFS